MSVGIHNKRNAQPVRHIDEGRLDRDTAYRVGYLSDFIGMTSTDWSAIHESGKYLAPLAGGLVDAIYEHLFAFDATKRHFQRTGSGYTAASDRAVDSLDHPYIQFRKEHLLRYIGRLVSGNYDGNFTQYLDMVGKMHTTKAGSAELNVPLVQMNALMGFVSTAVLAALWETVRDPNECRRYVLAWNKLFWVQNDLINRHYTCSSADARSHVAKSGGRVSGNREANVTLQ